ncbi:protein transporter TIM23 [Sugiyamaella lignohabitans]|uniref:Protein transporter TIM23 n=1 Tax=Sugiyamaella lignohabitans TaxID=796027 RepID=A0A167C9C6_9ASCO|nr:protein transporter TIM23 [Sugiyamaella lignohabitans]ANB11389.1 protein transporter TIM23 [Sugiyamaella lignohabitans]
MSWLLGGGSSTKQQEPVKEQTFAFDPSEATNVSSFLTPQALDVSKLHPLAGLNQNLEYLTLEDETPAVNTGILPIKDWTDDLCYGTGIVYLSGLGIGGAYGLAEGLRKTADSKSARLRLNGVLNAVTRRGPFLGNSAGVIALVYNLVNSSIDYFRGEHDSYNSIAAGAISGALFKATKGPKAMAISSGLVSVAAGVWCAVKKSVF